MKPKPKLLTFWACVAYPVSGEITSISDRTKIGLIEFMECFGKGWTFGPITKIQLPAAGEGKK